MTMIDAVAAASGPAEEGEVGYTRRDACAYALGVGCRASEAAERRYVWPYASGGGGGGGPPTLPTFVLALAFRGDEEAGRASAAASGSASASASAPASFPPRGLLPGFPEGLAPPGALVHAEQWLEVLRPLAGAGRVRMSARTLAVRAMRAGALWETETLVRDARDDALCARMLSSTIVLGLRGFSPGEREGTAGSGSPLRKAAAAAALAGAPPGPPDAAVDLATSADQAALYALSGDGNPLHVDPDVAKAAGFDRPILHGLCTLGFAVRAVLGAFGVLEDPQALRAVHVRFASPVFPGETLRTRMWRIGGGEGAGAGASGMVAFETVVPERGDIVVLSRGVCCIASVPQSRL